MEENKNNKNIINNNLHKLGDKTNEISNRFTKYRESTFSKFPLLFMLLSSFGLVATFYGFEKVIDQIGFFSEYPSMVLFTGIVVLVITGSLYKKLN